MLQTQPTPEDIKERATRDAQLIRVAEALGVQPAKGNHHIILISTQNGQAYSWVDLVEAHIKLLEQILH